MFPTFQKLMKLLAVFAVLASLAACGGSDNPGSGGGGGNPAPTLSSVSPNAGTYKGGTAIVLAGKNFQAGLTVTVGGALASVQSVTATQVAATTPPHATGAVVDITVTNPDGQLSKLAFGFTYTQTQQELARDIMGANYFGPEDAVKYLGVTPTADELTYLQKVPFSKADLMAKKDTHVLVAYVPTSVNDLLARLPAGTIAFCDTDPRITGAPFTNARNIVNWHLVERAPVPGSFGLDEYNQSAMLTPNEYNPAAMIPLYAMAGHYLQTGEVLMTGVFARTVDNVDSVAHPGYTDGITVGGNACGGRVAISWLYNGAGDPSVGIAEEWIRYGTLSP